MDSLKRSITLFSLLALTGTSMVLPVFSGCGKAPKKPAAMQVPAMPAVTSKAISLPEEITEEAKLYDVAVLNTLPRQTPFVSLIVPDELSQLQETPQWSDPADNSLSSEPSQADYNPFANIKLDGVLYHAKNPMAILSFSGRTHIVRQGQVFTNTEVSPPCELEVVKIDKKSIELSSAGNTVKTLTVSSLAERHAKPVSPPTAKKAEPASASGTPFSMKDIESLPEELKTVFKNYFQSQASQPQPPPQPGTEETSAEAAEGQGDASTITNDSIKITFRPKGARKQAQENH